MKRKTTQVINLAPNTKKYPFDRKTDVSNQKNDPNNISTLFPGACDVWIDYHDEQCSVFGLVGSFKWIPTKLQPQRKSFLAVFGLMWWSVIWHLIKVAIIDLVQWLGGSRTSCKHNTDILSPCKAVLLNVSVNSCQYSQIWASECRNTDIHLGSCFCTCFWKYSLYISVLVSTTSTSIMLFSF